MNLIDIFTVGLTYICKLGPTRRRYQTKYPYGKDQEYGASLSKMPFSFEWMTNCDVPEDKNLDF